MAENKNCGPCPDRDCDSATVQMRDSAKTRGLETVWDRSAANVVCKFGAEGICCKICNMGPCRISPKTPKGTCGADANTIAARNLSRAVAAGTSAHSDHGRHLVHTLKMVAEGKTDSYKITDERKLLDTARLYAIEIEGRPVQDIANDLADVLEKEFSYSPGPMVTLRQSPLKRQAVWKKNKVEPHGIDHSVVELMHRTNMGVDHSFEHVESGSLSTSIADGWGGSMIATAVSDILFGTPTPVVSSVNIGVLSHDKVNIIVHGHEPTLSDCIAVVCESAEMIEYAKSKGAAGIQLAGMCCTGNEILMRHGVPVAGNFLQQELALMTGAVEMLLVDVQCVMPSLSFVANCFHTKVLSTSPLAHTQGFEIFDFTEENAVEQAKTIVRMAIDNFQNRKKDAVTIPDNRVDFVAGFSVRAIHEMLGGHFRSSFRPLNDAIIDGRIRGVAGVVGCNNPKKDLDGTIVPLVKELIKNDVIVLLTGCAAITCAKAGLLTPETANSMAGPGLREVCEAVGMPPVLHMGSCVDNSRILSAACDVLAEGGLGEDISDLPAAGAAPEWMSEKAVAIGHYFVASGMLVLLGSPLHVTGGEKLNTLLTKDVEEKFGGKFAWGRGTAAQVKLILDHIDKKREALGINKKRQRQLMDMKERRALDV
jgi:anaerobic carbon-monoxide dehydrogenase catalytic subunit